MHTHTVSKFALLILVQTTHLVISQEEYDAGSTKITNAEKNGATLVLPSFVAETFKTGKLVEAAAHAPKAAAAASVSLPDIKVADPEPVGQKRKGRAAAKPAAAAAAPADEPASEAKKVKVEVEKPKAEEKPKKPVKEEVCSGI
jgi:hypothetical protein